jgi:hypothetical protein
MCLGRPNCGGPKRYAENEKGTAVSAELASYGGGAAAGQGPFGFEPPLSPATGDANKTPMTTNMHGYLGLVPGNDEQPQPAAPAELQPAVAAPAPVPDPATGGTAALESLLLRFGLVSSDQLGEALREQAETGRPVGAIVVERGWVSAADVERLTGAPVVPIAETPPAAASEPAPFPAVPAFDELPAPPSPVFHVVEPVAEAPEAAPLAVAPVMPKPHPEPQIEPEPELPSVAPIVPFHGTFTPMDEPEPEPELDPQPAAVALPAPAPVAAVEPPLVSAPPVAVPAPAPAPVFAPFTAESEPTPPAVPLPGPAAAAPGQPSVKHLVIARLTTGERVEVNSYADRNAARAEAKALMAYLREGHPDWPFVNGRFIRPESIVSIDLETVLLS